MKKLFTFLSVLIVLSVNAQTNDTINVSPAIKLIRLTPHAYVHETYLYGDVPCNGMVLINGNEAFLFDTPSYDSLTVDLVNYLTRSMNLTVKGCIVNDWHIDSQGGLTVIQRMGIPTYANNMTIQFEKEKGLPVAQNGFTDSLKLTLGNLAVEAFYFGAAHTMDNILVWIPVEKVLFADCMIKEVKAQNLGFTDDGSVEAYPATLQKVAIRFHDARFVIPGHGAAGGFELVKHTLELAEKK
jgi:metallo-beta-lactamase class B